MPSEELLKQYKQLEETNKQNELESVRQTERIKSLHEERAGLLKELEKLGVTEEELPKKIESLEKEITAEIKKGQDLLK